MPNWCATNYLLRGPKDKIQDFCDKVNSCYDKPDAKPNGFGKLWLGNIYAAFGYNPETISTTKHNLRGILNPDPELEACFCGPEPDESNPKLYPVQSGDEWAVAFSTMTAWSRSEWIDEMLDKQFPQCRYAWKTTDEFGNFHNVYHPELMHATSIEIHYHGDNCIEDMEFAFGKEDEAAKKLEELTGMHFTADEIKDYNKDFWDKIKNYNEAHEDNYIEIMPWDIVTD